MGFFSGKKKVSRSPPTPPLPASLPPANIECNPPQNAFQTWPVQHADQPSAAWEQPAGNHAQASQLVASLPPYPAPKPAPLYFEPHDRMAFSSSVPSVPYLATSGSADEVAKTLDDALTLIDLDQFTDYTSIEAPPPTSTDRSVTNSGGRRDRCRGQPAATASSLVSDKLFSKVDLYANSSLPCNLPPLQLEIPTYRLLCLAAKYAARVYERPLGEELDTHIEADWRTSTKAMRIKSVPVDHMDVIVFAIRGTSTFMDWAVNLNMAPTSPAGFLDDVGNLCHAGFLRAAQRMIGPVVSRLRRVVQEKPSRSAHSLIITGHSAGGAVASLLYSHMLARTVSSELNSLSGYFKRVHCITFGAPPVSLLPLMKPDRPELRESLFLSFVNQGDPVARADKRYVMSLLELLAAPAPGHDFAREPGAEVARPTKTLSKNRLRIMCRSQRGDRTHAEAHLHSATRPVWPLPPSTLSNAGAIVLLRSGNAMGKARGKVSTIEARLNEGVVAQMTSDNQLRTLVWGDPVCHVMRLYEGRIETLAVDAVTAQGYGKSETGS